jgi:hypothetical protein
VADRKMELSGGTQCFSSQDRHEIVKKRALIRASLFSHRKENGTLRIEITLHFLTPFHEAQ